MRLNSALLSRMEFIKSMVTQFVRFKNVNTASYDRPLSKLAESSELREGMERKTGVYALHEDSSTVPTKQFADTIGFRKRPNVIYHNPKDWE